MSETVNQIFGSLATVPGGKQGLLDRSKELENRHNDLRKEFDEAKGTWQKEIAELKKSYYIATGVLSAIIFILELVFKK